MHQTFEYFMTLQGNRMLPYTNSPRVSPRRRPRRSRFLLLGDGDDTGGGARRGVAPPARLEQHRARVNDLCGPVACVRDLQLLDIPTRPVMVLAFWCGAGPMQGTMYVNN